MQRKVRTSAKRQLDFRETKQWKEAEVFLIGEGRIANSSGLTVVYFSPIAAEMLLVASVRFILLVDTNYLRRKLNG